MMDYIIAAVVLLIGVGCLASEADPADSDDLLP
jgi:hypothetical protein